MDGSLPESDYSLRSARLLRSAANDLKRDDASAEQDLGLPPGTFAELTSGRRPVDWGLVGKAAAVWPLNERDLLPIHDDCPDGVRIHRLADSVASGRTINRGGSPYYEYRDTAMSRVASYRPEWISMLRVVEDSDPDNPAVEWNRGHLLYQFTYFVGPVNYYYRWEGVSHCVEMNTGDSVWGLPFAPHSFTSRSSTEPAYILALTYGGDLLGDAQRELSVLGAGAARALALPAEQGALLRSFAQARLLSGEELARRAKLPAPYVAQLLSGEASASSDETAALAEALGVAVRELLPTRIDTEAGVHLAHRSGARSWELPEQGRAAYRVSQLAGDPAHPHTTALEVDVLPGADASDGWLTTYQHQYVYVLDGAPVELHWEHRGERRTERLEPGDSAYVLPGTRLAFAAVDAAPGGPTAQVLLLRVGGATTTDVRFALATIPGDGIERYLDEDRLWFTSDAAPSDAARPAAAQTDAPQYDSTDQESAREH